MVHPIPKPWRPQAHHSHGQQQHGVDHTHPSHAPEKYLDVGDRRKLAEQLGVGSPTQLMKEQSELLQKAAEKKEHKNIMEALAGESLNVEQQKEMLWQFSERKKREDQERIRKNSRDVCRDYDEAASYLPSHQPTASLPGKR